MSTWTVRASSNAIGPRTQVTTRALGISARKTAAKKYSRHLRVGGCSGTGSPLIEPLARNCVGELLLLDPNASRRRTLPHHQRDPGRCPPGPAEGLNFWWRLVERSGLRRGFATEPADDLPGEQTPACLPCRRRPRPWSAAMLCPSGCGATIRISVVPHDSQVGARRAISAVRSLPIDSCAL